METKRIVLATVFVVASVTPALADKDIGCGIGTQLWAGQEGVVFKVLGATTNGSFGNQTFGITSGTLGCDQGGVVTADARLQMFAGANMDNLARDMARGEGETLDAFAHLMNISDADKVHFFHFTQAHFGELFQGETTTAGEMLGNLKGLMARDRTLSAYVPA